MSTIPSMAMYEYRCMCGRLEVVPTREPPRCPKCGFTMSRRYSFSIKTPMQAHFNHTVGKYVTNEADFRSKLRQASDELSASSGIEHDFQPVDGADRAALGVTEEAVAEKQRHIKDHPEQYV